MNTSAHDRVVYIEHTETGAADAQISHLGEDCLGILDLNRYGTVIIDFIPSTQRRDDLQELRTLANVSGSRSRCNLRRYKDFQKTKQITYLECSTRGGAVIRHHWPYISTYAILRKGGKAKKVLVEEKEK
jgi:hypothetical protein